MQKKTYRLGTTSFIITPGDLRDNVRHLAGRAEDVELVLYDTEDGQSNLPTPEIVSELAQLGQDLRLSYTVHLMQDLHLGQGHAEAEHASLLKARRVIELTRPLDPWAYVVHLDGREVIDPAATSPSDLRRWQDSALRALELAAGWAGDAALLAVENLETYAPDFIDPVMARMPEASRCVDIGHLWVDGHDALPYLQAALPRTRVIHIHGVSDRAHQSLTHAPLEQLDGVLRLLEQQAYAGVVTLEIFEDEDLRTSTAAVMASLERIAASGE
jgi:sugar phosphate isomerase/epimerase